jgi:hypothetical protein
MFGIVTSHPGVVNFLIDQKANRKGLISVMSAGTGLVPMNRRTSGSRSSRILSDKHDTTSVRAEITSRSCEGSK